MKKKNTLCIDFDGTLCSKTSFNAWTIDNKPNENALSVLKRLHEKYEIVIFTTRANDEVPGDVTTKIRDVKDWLTRWEIPYDRITCKKPMAIAYIDDRGLRFTNWNDMANYFLQ